MLLAVYKCIYKVKVTLIMWGKKISLEMYSWLVHMLFATSLSDYIV